MYAHRNVYALGVQLIRADLLISLSFSLSLGWFLVFYCKKEGILLQNCFESFGMWQTGIDPCIFLALFYLFFFNLFYLLFLFILFADSTLAGCPIKYDGFSVWCVDKYIHSYDFYFNSI